jgi:hypothetical protein
MKEYLQKTTSAAPLAIFRIALGLLLFASIVRFWAKGWIDELYVRPTHFFSFYGFEFIRPLGDYTYLIFIICGISALFFAIGLFYRYSATALFLSFTYIELMDKSTYLNHYYFISMICLLMIFLPANAFFSVDASRRRALQTEIIPVWCVDSIKVFVALLYIFAGLAKVNSDWLLYAQPLRIWLPAKNDLPLIGNIFNFEWVAYVFSWFGCLYDLTIPFLLWKRSTRAYAYAAVIVFHVLTSILFPIGMFPYIMIATALIFFSAEFHNRIIVAVAKALRLPTYTEGAPFVFSGIAGKITRGFLITFFAIHLALPFRYMLYPGELFWTEEGYRFSWRVMLMEKAGYAQFTVKDDDGKFAVVDNSRFLTPLQEKMMATQPDMILQYAHILRDQYRLMGFKSPRVFVDSYVTLNGRLSRPYINSLTDLAREKDSFAPKPWILPFDNDIKGF